MCFLILFCSHPSLYILKVCPGPRKSATQLWLECIWGIWVHSILTNTTSTNYIYRYITLNKYKHMGIGWELCMYICNI